MGGAESRKSSSRCRVALMAKLRESALILESHGVRKA